MRHISKVENCKTENKFTAINFDFKTRVYYQILFKKSYKKEKNKKRVFSKDIQNIE